MYFVSNTTTTHFNDNGTPMYKDLRTLHSVGIRTREIKMKPSRVTKALLIKKQEQPFAV
jgi:hypothetical protein